MGSSRWWSWHVTLTAVALVVLLAAVHFFVLVPGSFSVDGVLVFHRVNGTDEEDGGVDCKQQHVVYRNATWKPQVGCWLSQCDDSISIPVVEKLWEKKCNSHCNSRGVCNKELGQCRCSVGFSGPDCETEELHVCNKDVSREKPFGPWRVSICPGQCDNHTAHCVCGESSKYPNRPLGESCGFRLSEDGVVDWTQADFGYVYGNASYKGWCNFDAKEVHEKGIPLKLLQCDCRYDGLTGVVCEIPTESFCLNQCSNNGLCQHGFCACRKGWYGVDCSVPSFEERPTWMANVTSEERSHVITLKKRPLVYVYDLPSEFTTQLLQGRHYKHQCVNRLYTAQNETMWTEYLYGAEIAFYESLLASEHRTTNGDEADFFYVPLLHACIVQQADDSPYMNMQGKFMGLRQYFAGDYARRAYLHIQQAHPYWNRSSGRDHIWFFPWDEGACSAPKEIWNSMMLVHWGNTNAFHNRSTTAYHADNWDPIPEEWRGNHPCYDPAKDLVMPAWKFPDPFPISEHFSSRPRQDRHILFYFNGNLGNAYENGRPENSYSMGIRQRVAAEYGSQPDKNGKLGRQAAGDMVVQASRRPEYKLDLSRSRFCGVFPGDGWSGRMEDSILNGCIPVIIQDGIQLPFENVLDYESFAVRIAEEDIPNLTTILRAMNETKVDSMLAVIRSMWQRFTYHHAVQLEAKRQKLTGNNEYPWASAYNTLTGDDAFSTFIQVLHHKLHADEWRRETKQQPKDHGVPERCKRKLSPP